MLRKIVGLVAVLALGLTALAVADGGDGPPKTDAAQATFALTKSGTQERTCTGADGTYRDARETFTGTSSSGDARLAGALELHTRSFVNQDSGLGTTSGKLTLRDPDTGALKAKGALVAVNTERGVLDGVVVGKLKAADGGRLTGNFHATFNADGTQVTGELGGGTATNGAVVQDGHCSGRVASGDDHRSRGHRHGHDRDDD